jgi:hypothetical protein
MNKKTFGITLAFLTLIAGLVFAEDTCTYYTSDSSEMSARISVNENEATIDVRSYVGHERIAIYEIDIDGFTFGEWDISGTLILNELGSTTVTVKNTDHEYNNYPAPRKFYFNSSPSVTVKAKTCD